MIMDNVKFKPMIIVANTLMSTKMVTFLIKTVTVVQKFAYHVHLVTTWTKRINAKRNPKIAHKSIPIQESVPNVSMATTWKEMLASKRNENEFYSWMNQHTDLKIITFK